MLLQAVFSIFFINKRDMMTTACYNVLRDDPAQLGELLSVLGRLPADRFAHLRYGSPSTAIVAFLKTEMAGQ